MPKPVGRQISMADLHRHLIKWRCEDVYNHNNVKIKMVIDIERSKMTFHGTIDGLTVPGSVDDNIVLVIRALNAALLAEHKAGREPPHNWSCP